MKSKKWTLYYICNNDDFEENELFFTTSYNEGVFLEFEEENLKISEKIHIDKKFDKIIMEYK